MLTAELNSRDLASLREPREFPAVSVIMPTHRTYPDSKQDPLLLRNLLADAATRLDGANLPRGMAAEVMDALDSAAAGVDLRHAADALALFAAPGGESCAFTLPYVRPEPRVQIGRSFATRELVSAQEHIWSYWVLALSEQPTRLWSGAGERLTESLASSFPLDYADWLPDDSRPGNSGPENSGPGNSGPGKREPVPRARRAEEVTAVHIEEGRREGGRRERFFRHVLGEMASVLSRESRPLVVTGVTRYLAYFDQLAPASVKSQFAGSVEGSFDQASGPELAQHVSPVLAAERERWQHAAIERLDTARSERLFASGLSQVWDLAAAGQVRELLAEEGYLAPARESGGHLLPPGDLGGDPVDDAVDTVMDAVLNGAGEVIFVRDGSLDNYDRIAASLRY
jgi:hypothetical protein